MINKILCLSGLFLIAINGHSKTCGFSPIEIHINNWSDDCKFFDSEVNDYRTPVPGTRGLALGTILGPYESAVISPDGTVLDMNEQLAFLDPDPSTPYDPVTELLKAAQALPEFQTVPAKKSITLEMSADCHNIIWTQYGTPPAQWQVDDGFVTQDQVNRSASLKIKRNFPVARSQNGRVSIEFKPEDGSRVSGVIKKIGKSRLVSIEFKYDYTYIDKTETLTCYFPYSKK